MRPIAGIASYKIATQTNAIAKWSGHKKIFSHICSWDQRSASALRNLSAFAGALVAAEKSMPWSFGLAWGFSPTKDL
jgi:hypothetical protein